MLGIDILMKNYPSTASFILDFSLVKNKRQEWLSKVRMRYRKTVGEWKNIERDFYVNDSPNDDLESEI